MPHSMPFPYFWGWGFEANKSLPFPTIGLGGVPWPRAVPFPRVQRPPSPLCSKIPETESRTRYFRMGKGRGKVTEKTFVWHGGPKKTFECWEEPEEIFDWHGGPKLAFECREDPEEIFEWQEDPWPATRKGSTRTAFWGMEFRG